MTAGQYATMDALFTEINDKLDDALGTGFGEAAAGVANVYASTSGPNNDRIKFTTADWGSAYSIKAIATNADDEWEANYALGIGIDSVGHTGTDGLIQIDDYVNAINRIDCGLDRNYVIGDAESGTEDRGTIGVTIRGLTTGGGGLNIGNALLDVDAAIDEVSEVRGTLGSFQKNTLESNLKNLRIAGQNLQSSESNIRDTDMTLEMSTFVKNQILLQAGTAMLAQANQVPQVVLWLFG